MSENILVVPTPFVTATLGKLHGCVQSDSDVLAALFSRGLFMPRDDMEKDRNFKQLIPYVVVTNTDGDAFVYTRTKKQGERRLHGKRSIGIGGHVNSDDAAGDPDKLPPPAADVFTAGMLRELGEELKSGEYDLSYYGLVNDDTNDVGAVHLGVVYLASLRIDQTCEPRDPLEMAAAGFWQPKTLRRLSADFETWSQMCIATIFADTAAEAAVL